MCVGACACVYIREYKYDNEHPAHEICMEELDGEKNFMMEHHCITSHYQAMAIFGLSCPASVMQ